MRQEKNKQNKERSENRKKVDYTLKQLRYFVAVAEQGSITLAAETLFISQPAISNAINQLEESFRSQLLIRHHAKGVVLTAAGKNLLSSAKSLLSHAEELSFEASEHSDSMNGTLNIGCFLSIAPILLPSLLNEFGSKYPGTRFKVTAKDIEQLEQGLLDGQLELALTYDLYLNPTIETKELWRMEPYVLLSKNHPLAKRRSISLKALEEEPMILFDVPHSREYFYSILSRNQITPRFEHRTDNFEFVRSLVANNRGYSILNLKPKTLTSYDGKELAYVPIKDSDSALSVVIAKREAIRLTARARKFWEFCQQTIPKMLKE